MEERVNGSPPKTDSMPIITLQEVTNCHHKAPRVFKPKSLFSPSQCSTLPLQWSLPASAALHILPRCTLHMHSHSNVDPATSSPHFWCNPPSAVYFHLGQPRPNGNRAGKHWLGTIPWSCFPFSFCLWGCNNYAMAQLDLTQHAPLLWCLLRKYHEGWNSMKIWVWLKN